MIYQEKIDIKYNHDSPRGTPRLLWLFPTCYGGAQKQHI